LSFKNLIKTPRSKNLKQKQMSETMSNEQRDRLFFESIEKWLLKKNIEFSMFNATHYFNDFFTETNISPCQETFNIIAENSFRMTCFEKFFENRKISQIPKEHDEEDYKEFVIWWKEHSFRKPPLFKDFAKEKHYIICFELYFRDHKPIIIINEEDEIDEYKEFKKWFISVFYEKPPHFGKFKQEKQKCDNVNKKQIE
jgi:hypothetical protein